MDGFIDWVMNALIGLFFAGMVGFIIAFVLPMSTKMTRTTYGIESLQDGSSMEGHFFLGCGSIEGEMKYIFYYKDEVGYKMAQIDVDDAVIKYSDRRKVVEIKEELTENWINLFGLDILEDNKYEIYVPNGTIRNDFNLDSK